MEVQHSAVLQRTCFRSVVICPIDKEGNPAPAWLHPNSTHHAASSLLLHPVNAVTQPTHKVPLYDFLISLFHAGSASGGVANANFANFDNFPKSCSADFGSFSSSSQSNSTGADRDAVQSTSLPADRYAALADLDNVFSSAKTEQGKLLLPSLSHRSQL